MVLISGFSFAQEVLTWKMLHPVSKKWIAFGEKGSVQEALIATGELPDPYVGVNEDRFSWIENYQWTLQTVFELNASQMSQKIELDFPSIDTYAKIYVNNQLVAATENSFVHYYFDIKKMVVLGRNTVKIVFTPPVMYQKPILSKVGVTLPAPNDVGKLQVQPHCRKPQYQFGWDWSLRMLTMGFWEPVSILTYQTNRVIQHGIKTLSVSYERAKQEFSLELSEDSSESLIWESALFGPKEVTPQNGKLIRVDELENPELWWPRGQGSAHLYSDSWVLKTKEGEIIYEKKVRFGVKTVELVQEKDQWGTSFYLKINGRMVFCKGADYIPDDIFPARITDEKLQRQVAEMLECNFNMVRIWGGGLYPRESFLEACDVGGLMVWQDFMFACAMYPGTDEFLKNVEKEVSQQITRMSSHASLVLFNGNNEVEVAWKNWGFQSQYKLNKKDEILIESYYQKLFEELIPNQVKTLSTLPYEHTSPLSNWGNDEYYKHGTQHYWGVWHGQDSIEDFAKKYGRFNAEFGFQSFPEEATLLTFSTQKDWNLEGVLMKKRQKSYVGNQMISKHADILFGKTNDFLRFVYYSQLTQAKAVSLAVVSHRMNFPKCTGTLYWQYNDCWPAPTWSSVDYYGRWKALQYQMKEDFRDVAICQTVDSLHNDVFVFISDAPEGVLCHIQAKYYTLEGELFDSSECNQALAYPHAAVLFERETNLYKPTNYVVEFSWNDNQNHSHKRTFVHLRNKEVELKKAVPEVKIEIIDRQAGKGLVEVTNSVLLRDFWLSSKKGRIKMDQNFIHLLPGKHVLSFDFEGELTTDDINWFYR